MDPAETPVYHVLIGCGSIIFFFTLLFASSSIWLQRRLWRKIRLKTEANLNRIEQERVRIAADLHDEINPIIYSVRRKIEDAVVADEGSRQLLNEARKQLVAMEEQLQSISRSMASLSLQQNGLLYSLQELVFDKNMRDNISIDLQCEALPALSTTAATHIYRMVQEIIHNTIKHAAASRLVIRFDYEQPTLFIRSSDNGKGFDIHTISSAEQGLGIGNILNRARYLHGTAEVQARNGCQWEIKLKVG